MNAFDPYGRMTKTQGDKDSPFTYTGHFWHAPSQLNLTFYRAYDPNLGRWLSRDPIGEQGGLNVYEYVKSDPLNAIDPSGLVGIHGNWCGPNWTGGHPESYVPRQYGYYKPPIDALDRVCELHDKCYYSCRCSFKCDEQKRSDCFRWCDYRLTRDAYSVGGLMGYAVGAAIDRPGRRDPGPDDPNLPCPERD